MPRRFWVFALLAVAGCATVPDDDYPYADGPYDGGVYYDHPRTSDYDVEQRYVYGRTYYYPPPYYGPYPGFYHGYTRDRFHDDHDHGRGDDGPGRSRERPSPTRADDRAASPPRAASPRVAPAPARPGGVSSGGPHGRH